MIFDNILGKTKGFVEESSGGVSRSNPFRHACPLHDKCGIVHCNIGNVHATNCVRYPFLKDELEKTGKNQAQK